MVSSRDVQTPFGTRRDYYIRPGEVGYSEYLRASDDAGAWRSGSGGRWPVGAQTGSEEASVSDGTLVKRGVLGLVVLVGAKAVWQILLSIGANLLSR